MNKYAATSGHNGHVKIDASYGETAMLSEHWETLIKPFKGLYGGL